MKRKLLLLLAALLPIVASASVCINGIYYNFFGDEATVTSGTPKYSGSVVIPASVTYNGKTYTVTNIGDDAFSGCNNLTSITIPNSLTDIGRASFYGCSNLTSVTIGNGVTIINEWAFSGCTNLTSITLPNSLTDIGRASFYGCSNLTSVTIGNSVTIIDEWTFAYCSSLTSVIIPSGVKSIGIAAFLECFNLTSVTIPSTITTIGDWAFSSCSLTSINLPVGVTSIGEHAFWNCSSLSSIIIPNGVTSIGDWAFAECSDLTSVTIPSSVTTIGETAFYECGSMTSVHITDLSAWFNIRFGNYMSNPLMQAHHLYLNDEEIRDIVIPNSVTSINDYVFSGFSGLNSISIPNSVTSIGKYAFFECDGLTSVTIPEGVTNIGNNAFNKCTNLVEVTLPNTLTSIGYSAFDDCYALAAIDIPRGVTFIDGAAFSDCRSLTSLIIPEGIPSIGEFFCDNCTGLTSITIPNSVTSIGNWAFSSCSGLTSINIGNNVSSIGEFAFQGCSNLTNITLPQSVTSIGDYAFSNCTGLTDVYCYAENVPSTESNAFNESKVEYSRLHVPVGSVASYKETAPWSGFGAIVGIGDNTETVEIATAEDLKNFADRVNAGETLLCAKLTADIDFTAYPTSTIKVWYYGEFDGAGHSIRLAMNRTSDCALFGFICGYVHDLTTTGTITTSVQFAGGIAAQTGKATIERCQSRMDIISSVNGDGTHGGIVGISHDGTVIRDCIFSGSITGSNTTCCGGVSGWADGITRISNCLVKGDITVSTTNSDLLSGNSGNVVSLNNYFQGDWNAANNCGVTVLTEGQVESGETCCLLNAGRTGEEMAWYQTLGTDDYPIPDSSKPSVYEIKVSGPGYATFVPKKNIAAIPEGITAYTAQVNKHEEGYVYLATVTELPADNAVIIKANQDTYYCNSTTENRTLGQDNDLTFSNEEVAANGTQYVLANDEDGVGFYKATTGKIAARKAYFISNSNVKAFFLEIDDETGIEDLNKQYSLNTQIHDLSGRKLDKPTKGINIIRMSDGTTRKVMIK